MSSLLPWAAGELPGAIGCAVEAETGQNPILPFCLLALALGLLMLEFIVPSFGQITLLSITAAVAGGLTAYRQSTDLFLAYIAVTFLGLPVVLVLSIKAMKRSSLTLRGSSIPPPSDPGDVTRARSNIPAVGAEGSSETTLRPAGKARIGGRLVDVVSEGEFIEKGAPLRVVRLEGNWVVVREAGP